MHRSEETAMTEQLRIWAGLQGFLSAAALLSLLLFFALATPFGAERRQWSWLGPVNDWLSVVGAVPWIVAMVLLAGRARAPVWVWVLTGAVAAGIVAGAVVTLLMLAGRATLPLQATVTLPVAVAGYAWMAIVGGYAAGAVAIARWVALFAYVLLAALLLAVAVVGLAFALPESSRTPLFVIGGVVGGLAWAGFPVWWLAVASTAR